MQFRRNLLSRPFRNSDPDADAGGGFADTPTTEQTPGTDPAATVADPAPDTGTKASTMLEAMFGQQQAPASEAEKQEAAAAGKTVQQLRDERGRFAGKAPEAQAGQTQAKPGQQTDPKTTKPDPNGMPDGLTPKAQERFRELANTAKELTAKVQEYEPIVASARQLQQAFHQNNVNREQFDHAMAVVGMMNRGDLRGALAALDEQRRMIALHLGQSVPGVDLLSEFPDLQAKVANMQLAPEDAEELARNRLAQRMQQQQGQRQQQEQQRAQEQQRTQQEQQQAVRDGQLAVDKFCQGVMKTDLDYARIEPLLLNEIQDGLLQGVPPSQWARIVEKTYGLIKQTASQMRPSSGATTTVLRPTGGEAPTAKPQNAFEAMWGKSKPAGA